MIDASGSVGAAVILAARLPLRAVDIPGSLEGWGRGAGGGSTKEISAMIVSVRTRAIDGGCAAAGEGIGNSGCSGSGTTAKCERSASYRFVRQIGCWYRSLDLQGVLARRREYL